MPAACLCRDGAILLDRNRRQNELRRGCRQDRQRGPEGVVRGGRVLETHRWALWGSWRQACDFAIRLYRPSIAQSR
jgi:hypothetical protein